MFSDNDFVRLQNGNILVLSPSKPEFSKVMKYYLIGMTSFLLFFTIFIANVDWSIRWESFWGLVGYLDGIPLGIYLLYWGVKWSKYNLATKNKDEYERRALAWYENQQAEARLKSVIIEQEYKKAVESQSASEPWATRYSTSPCPHCGHYKVRHAKWEDKSMSVAFWGAASSKIGTNYKCDNCKQMWE